MRLGDYRISVHRYGLTWFFQRAGENAYGPSAKQPHRWRNGFALTVRGKTLLVAREPR